MAEPTEDPFDLKRFITAQAPLYADALAELRQGEKRTHWMWFVFPQVAGLGRSPTAQHYAIQSRDEAQAYLAHPVLGARLCECTRAVLDSSRSAHQIFGSPDDLKFHSCLTLFERISGNSFLTAALAKFFRGELDRATLEILARWAKTTRSRPWRRREPPCGRCAE
jgi:uncharacterized protein (DUF1810 family)